jgi:hypothetical protein
LRRPKTNSGKCVKARVLKAVAGGEFRPLRDPPEFDDEDLLVDVAAD